jgi:hypothetical protein
MVFISLDWSEFDLVNCKRFLHFSNNHRGFKSLYNIVPEGTFLIRIIDAAINILSLTEHFIGKNCPRIIPHFQKMSDQPGAY